MKSTDQFKTTIENKLNEMAAADDNLAANLQKEGKNIDDCVTYILNRVQKSGCNGFTDDEIFGMAIHYYDEDDIKVGNPINTRVVVNHRVELTADDKKQAKEEARQQLINEEKERLKKRTQKKKDTQTAGNVQQSLF
jgi:hypothetical protein